MTTTTSFKGVTDLGLPLETEQLESNIASFFQWGALGIGAFSNVSIPTVGAYGGNQHQLRMSDDPSITSGTQWEGFRKDWVWERNVEYGYQPIAISGVYVNGTFHPSNSSGTYAHYVDYPNGAVVFENSLSGNSVVTCEFSYRNVQITLADAPWWRLLQQESFQIDGDKFQQSASGDWSVSPQNRLQLPAVVVEATSNFTSTPKEVGGSAGINTQDIMFHIVAENRSDMTKWADIVRNQWQHRVALYDAGAVADANAFPIRADGSLASGAKMYPELVKSSGEGGFFWRQMWFKNVRGAGPFVAHDSLRYTTVRATVEFDK